MGPKWLFGVAGMVVATTLAACMAAPDEDVGGGSSRVSQAEFNKNNVLTDTALRDKDALSVDDIQAFLEKTPWNKESVLATYTENEKSAAQIIHDAANEHGINPIELLVRVQMEQGLISKTTASDESISIAFGCGCPHSPVCSSKYEGFANQADCAAGTLSRSMDRALTSEGTVSGWKKGEEKATQDDIEVTPSNAATAALYTYTPWVGEAGGGKKGVGGASLHYQVWGRFADALDYGVAKSGSKQTKTNAADSGPDPEVPDSGEGEGEGEGEADAGPAPQADSGVPAQGGGSSADGGAPSNSSNSSGNDDSDILSEGNAPPATNAPPPRGSSRSNSNSSSSNGDEGEETEAKASDLAGKKQSNSGCSSTGNGGNVADASLIGLAMVAASVVAKRRRRQD
jgi:hypothetical protein